MAKCCEVSAPMDLALEDGSPTHVMNVPGGAVVSDAEGGTVSVVLPLQADSASARSKLIQRRIGHLAFTRRTRQESPARVLPIRLCPPTAIHQGRSHVSEPGVSRRSSDDLVRLRAVVLAGRLGGGVDVMRRWIGAGRTNLAGGILATVTSPRFRCHTRGLRGTPLKTTPLPRGFVAFVLCLMVLTPMRSRLQHETPASVRTQPPYSDSRYSGRPSAQRHAVRMPRGRSTRRTSLLHSDTCRRGRARSRRFYGGPG